MKTHERISIDPAIMAGKPCIKGTRVPVTTLIKWLGKGFTIDELLAQYPTITRDDILAALLYASDFMDSEVVLAAAE